MIPITVMMRENNHNPETQRFSDNDSDNQNHKSTHIRSNDNTKKRNDSRFGV